MRIRGLVILLAVGGLVLGTLWAEHAAAQSSSNNYKVEESMFGTGGELDASSTNYRAKQSAGDLVVGNAASTNYQFQGGFNTTDQPLLEFAVNGGTFDLGVLDPTATGAISATFTVRNYLSSGYTVAVSGAPPSTTSGSTHTLTALTTQTGSTPGNEQFGINLTTNTNPPVGADPSQTPDVSFGFGAATNGYALANLFKFVSGDTVAFSNKSSGQTNYTMSVIANVARNTPAGQYGGTLDVQVVPSF